LAEELESAGVNCGLLIIKNAVVLRSPGSTYVDRLLETFDKDDVFNAIQLGLLTEGRAIGSPGWGWYIRTLSNAKRDDQ
jgi:hypothetical protein